MSKDDLTVVNQDGERQYVKSVEVVKPEVKTLSATKSTQLKVEFYNPLKSGDKYTFSVKVGEKTVSSTLEFEIADVAKVVAETTQVGKENPTVKYKVLDENGLDITSIAKVKYESNRTINQESGELALPEGESAFVYVIAVDKDGKELAKSERITVKAEAEKVTKLVAYTVGTADFDKKDFEAEHTLRTNDTDKTLKLYVENQFGDKSLATDVTYESLNKEVALVDRVHGTITPLKTGSVPVRVKVGDFTKVIELTVEEAAKVNGLSLDKAELNLSDKLADGDAVEVTIKDQYGKAVETSGKIVKANVKEGKELITIDNIATTNGKGVANFDVKPVKDKEGTAVVEFTHEAKIDGKDTTFTTTLTVNVTKAGAVNDYVVEGFKEELDKYAGKDGKNTTSMNLSVFGIDANGTKATKVDSPTIKVFDKDDKEVSGELDAQKNKYLKKGETYKVVVSVKSLKIFEQSFVVVDSTPADAKPTLEQIGSKLTVSDTSQPMDLSKVFEVTFEEAKDVTITGITFDSDNSTVAKPLEGEGNELKISSEKDGKATITVREVTVTFTEKDSVEFIVDSPHTIKLAEPALIELTVDADETAESDLVKKINDKEEFVSFTDNVGYISVSFDWNDIDSDLLESPASKVLKSFKFTLKNNDGEEISETSLDIGGAHQTKVKEGEYKEGPVKVSGVNIYKHGDPVKAKLGKTAWNKGAIKATDTVKTIVVEIETLTGKKATAEYTIGE